MYNSNDAAAANTISDLISSGTLWVKNTTQPRMVLLLTIIDRAGRTTSTPIPDTPHPIHLSNHVPKDSLETCRDLLRLVNSGALAIVDQKQARAYYESNPMAMQALRRAFEKVENRSSPIARESITASDHNSKAEDAEKELAAVAADEYKGGHVDTAGVNLAIKGLVMNAKSGKLSSEDAALDLANMNATDMDLQYVVSSVDGHLREVAKQMLAARRA